jgi:LemA protein
LFPNNIVASMSGFQREDAYFKTEPGARTAPKVAF